jgi:hypothetical protein
MVRFLIHDEYSNVALTVGVLLDIHEHLGALAHRIKFVGLRVVAGQVHDFGLWPLCSAGKKKRETG